MGDRLAGKVAIVTGGGGGIGQATGRLFREEGASVALVDVDADAAQRAAKEIGGDRVLAIGAAIDDDAEAARAVQETVAAFGGLHVLVNVAGIRVWGAITEATPESWDAIVRGNLLSAAYCSKYAVPAMTEGGSIVNISSANAISGRSGMAQYDATKAGMLALTRSMACDHADQGIRVNSVCPGPTLTSFHIKRRVAATGQSYAEAEAEMRAAGSSNLLGRQADPREIAYSILFLACAESSYVTGATFMIDGGLSV